MSGRAVALVLALVMPLAAAQLRPENVTDVEVGHMLDAALQFEPGDTAYISEVRSGCDCHDGAECSDRAQVVVYRPQASVTVGLAKVAGRWDIAWHDRYMRRRHELLARCGRRGERADDEAAARACREELVRHFEQAYSCDHGNGPWRRGRG